MFHFLTTISDPFSSWIFLFPLLLLFDLKMYGFWISPFSLGILLILFPALFSSDYHSSFQHLFASLLSTTLLFIMLILHICNPESFQFFAFFASCVYKNHWMCEVTQLYKPELIQIYSIYPQLTLQDCLSCSFCPYSVLFPILFSSCSVIPSKTSCPPSL